ncbi:hypothetical protein PVAP13_2KG315334 [Panicum virgatum]|uniref:Uncharacterized protein n=1 Tax=Panicum virgatum TaxID=38727 RepID=A0A8T0W7M4_PANVG|nr:hypothetical protein PVAP13_2KG315334 [Panicum virgatum]
MYLLTERRGSGRRSGAGGGGADGGGPRTGSRRGGQGRAPAGGGARNRRPPRDARPGRRRARDRRPPRTLQAARPVARATPFLPRSAATDRRLDGGGPVEAGVVVPPGAARVVLPWRRVSPLRDAKKWRWPLPGRGWKRRKKEKGGLGLLAGPPSNGLSRATAHGATQSRQHMWRESALPRQLPSRRRSSVVAWSRQSMWRDSSGTRTTELGVTKRATVPARAGKGAAVAGAEAYSNRARPPIPMAVSRSACEPARLQARAASGRHSRTSAPPACCRGCGLAWPRVNTAHKLAWPLAARRQVGSAEGCARGAVPPPQRASTTPKVWSRLAFSLRAAVNERWQDGF